MLLLEDYRREDHSLHAQIEADQCLPISFEMHHNLRWNTDERTKSQIQLQTRRRQRRCQKVCWKIRNLQIITIIGHYPQG